MQSFKDTEGQAWDIKIDVGAVKRVRDALKVDLVKIDDGNLLQSLYDDPVLLVDVIFCLCQAQATTAGLSDVEFAERFGGDTVAEATEAFVAELIAFFPNPRRRDLLTAAMEKMQVIEDKVFDEADKKLAAITVDEIVAQVMTPLEIAPLLTPGDLSGNTLESSESTPPI